MTSETQLTYQVYVTPGSTRKLPRRRNCTGRCWRFTRIASTPACCGSQRSRQRPEPAQVTLSHSAGWPVMLAMRSKSLSQCSTVSPASSAAAAMIREKTAWLRISGWRTGR
jgi:hypothetical protein